MDDYLNPNQNNMNSPDMEDIVNKIRYQALEAGYGLFKTKGISGMVKLGSKNPIKLAKKMIAFYIDYEEYERCAVLQKIIDDYKTKYKAKKDK